MWDESTRKELHALTLAQALDVYEGIDHEPDKTNLQRWFARNDRFYLLTVLLGRHDAVHPWLYERCRDVEADPDGYLDLWAREHYKSTIITMAGIIQEIVRDPCITIGVFSHTKASARKFVSQIKFELETKRALIDLFPDIFWQNPERESPRWSVDGGIVVKRASNPRESTLEGYGLVDGMPTGAHFRLRVYDDVVTIDSVSTPDQVNKTTEAWSLSDNLGAVTILPDGRETMRRWHIGTRYSYADTYQHIIDNKILKMRVYPATHDGTIAGTPVFLSQEIWEHKLNTQLERDIACQQLQNPVAGNQAMFNRDWLRYYETRPETVNIYIMVDPASSRKKRADLTAIAVIAMDAAGNKYLVDGFRHKMNLAERWINLRNLWKRWSQMPGVQAVHVGYEKYGMQSDIEHFESEMERELIAFPIKELNWTREGNESKTDRVQRLVPDLKQSRFWLPSRNKEPSQRQQDCIRAGKPHLVGVDIRRKDHEGRAYSVIDGFIEEFNLFPFCLHDDFIDACSRIYDMDPRPPVLFAEADLEPNYV